MFRNWELLEVVCFIYIRMSILLKIIKLAYVFNEGAALRIIAQKFSCSHSTWSVCPCE